MLLNNLLSHGKLDPLITLMLTLIPNERMLAASVLQPVGRVCPISRPEQQEQDSNSSTRKWVVEYVWGATLLLQRLMLSPPPPTPELALRVLDL